MSAALTAPQDNATPQIPVICSGPDRQMRISTPELSGYGVRLDGAIDR